MQRIRLYGPSLVLGATALGVLLFGPAVMRHLAWAEQEARVEQARARQMIRAPELAKLNEAFREVAKVVEPSVVQISVRKSAGNADALRRLFPGSPDLLPRDRQLDPPEAVGSGSGWVYHDAKHIITNYHVVKDADEIVVQFSDKTTRKASLLGSDPPTDIAVLTVPGGALHASVLSRRPVEQGEMVFAFGSPFKFDFSMSQGIVSAKGRQLGILGSGGYENFIQTDAAINPGNSGGPLTDIHGQVVGMNSAIATRTGVYNGIGFAIPVSMIRHVVGQLVDAGRVRRGYLGVWIRDLDEKLARSYGFKGKGVLVEDMVAGRSAAAEAGVKRDDIITEIDGKPVRSAAELRRIVAQVPPSRAIEVKVYRGGKIVALKVRLSEQPADLAAVRRDGQIRPRPDGVGPDPLESLGLTGVRAMTRSLARRLNLTYAPGVVIETVRPGSVADRRGLRAGVLITEVMGEAVESAEALERELARHDLAKGVRIRVQVGGVSRVVLLAIEP
ncbi:MAG: trypsin-like peptidase domain-containing protein [Phycisphaerae bacterium]|nr:trypsin-like peptidase domain-containing protein [Phycisphaerae bacterium]